MARFEITEGKPFNTSFIIKDEGSTLAKVLLGTESGEFVLTTIEEVPVKVLTKVLTLGDLNAGEFLLSLSALETTGLNYEIGFKEDGSKFRATYRANVSFYNSNGTILAEAQIPQVFIIFEGI